jgi:hypothetical protein
LDFLKASLIRIEVRIAGFLPWKVYARVPGSMGSRLYNSKSFQIRTSAKIVLYAKGKIAGTRRREMMNSTRKSAVFLGTSRTITAQMPVIQIHTSNLLIVANATTSLQRHNQRATSQEPCIERTAAALSSGRRCGYGWRVTYCRLRRRSQLCRQRGDLSLEGCFSCLCDVKRTRQRGDLRRKRCHLPL